MCEAGIHAIAFPPCHSMDLTVISRCGGTAYGAVAQVKGCELLPPESGVFSHVYDLDRKCATGIPWGHGNGWVVNDNHGIGIVLLAGNELLDLENSM